MGEEMGRLPAGSRPAVLAAAAIAAVWGGTWLLSHTLHDRRMDDAVAGARGVVRGFESAASHALRDADTTLRLLALRYAEGGLPDAWALVERGLYNTALVDHIAVIEAQDGRIRVSGPMDREADLADRALVTAHRPETADALHIDTPRAGPLPGGDRPLLRLSRRLTDAGGRFAGVVVAAVDPAYFGAVLDRTAVGERGMVSLVGLDGIVRAHADRTGSTGVGASLADSALWTELERAPAGVVRDTGALDGQVRRVAYRRVDGYPLVALAGVAEADVAVAAGEDAGALTLVALLLTLAAGSAAAVIVAQRRAAERLSAALNLNRDFLARVSHELRTPLNAIIGFSEVIKDRALGPAAGDRYADCARDIHDAGQQLLLLVNDILDLSRLQAGTMELVQEPVDVGPVIEWGLRVVAPRAERKNLRLGMSVPSGTGRVLADPRALRQMLLNLLTNAVTFTPEGGSITVEAQRGPGGRCILHVADTGVGMTAEQVRTAALPFQQCSPLVARPGQGRGLGLAIVKALMEAHGGHLRIDSQPGCGSRVSLEFAG